MAITPRHYLDFINHYANLFHEKRSELEEQQMHLNVGLRKIKETVDQVRQGTCLTPASSYSKARQGDWCVCPFPSMGFAL